MNYSCSFFFFFKRLVLGFNLVIHKHAQIHDPLAKGIRSEGEQVSSLKTKAQKRYIKCIVFMQEIQV